MLKFKELYLHKRYVGLLTLNCSFLMCVCNSCTMVFLGCMGIVPNCGIWNSEGEARGIHLYIPHEGYNPYTLENHSTSDLCYDATIGECFPYHKHYTAKGVLSYTLVCMSFLEYAGFVLVLFPLKHDLIIAQIYISHTVCCFQRGTPFGIQHTKESRRTNF